jgi:hypothetical protein
MAGACGNGSLIASSQARRRARRATGVALTLALAFTGGCGLRPSSVRFDLSSPAVDAYDIVEIRVAVGFPHARNCFTDVLLQGTFQTDAGNKRWQIQGFCDSADGSVFRIRFMPPSAGTYRYFVEYQQGALRRTSAGTFRAADAGRKGPIRVDPNYRWHFIWEGTGEHYFFNGTTAYWLIGWKDEKVIDSSIDRLSRLKVNRIRVTLAGRTIVFYGEPVMLGEDWTSLTTVWPAGSPHDIYHPGFDYTRFDVAYWQKFERALRFARDRNVIISVVLDMNDSRVHPGAGGDDEHRFIKYAVARLAAFSNVTWDLGDDLNSYRDDSWTHQTGTLLKLWDPYQHLATSHPTDNRHQDRTSDWFDFTSFQEWSRHQHEFMLGQRRLQRSLGRIIPQTNEEYGYEDHYPLYAAGLGSESADALRRMAWEIVMAGGYQTSGETARRGTNIWPNTGGGWLNGRGDDTMVMFHGYAHMVDFFTSFEWWKTEPHDELVSKGAFCLALPDRIYAAYLPNGGATRIQLGPGVYRAAWFEAQTGRRIPLENLARGAWTSPQAPGSGDWALLLLRADQPAVSH